MAVIKLGAAYSRMRRAIDAAKSYLPTAAYGALTDALKRYRDQLNSVIEELNDQAARAMLHQTAFYAYHHVPVDIAIAVYGDDADARYIEEKARIIADRGMLSWYGSELSEENQAKLAVLIVEFWQEKHP